MTLKDIASKIFSVSRKPYEGVYGGKPSIPDVSSFVDQVRAPDMPVKLAEKAPVKIRPVAKAATQFVFGTPEERARIKVEGYKPEDVVRGFMFGAGTIKRAGAVQKLARKSLIDFVKKAKPLERTQAEIYTKTKGLRIGKAKEVATEGLAGLREMRSKLAGEMPKLPQFEPPNLSQKTVDDIANTIKNSNKLDAWEKIGASKGFEDVLKGRIPIKSHIALLEKEFGSEFASSLANLQTKWQKISGLAGEVLGVPRSLMAGGLDMSYGLRQGVFGAWKHPKQWASSFKKQFGWFAKEKNLAKSMTEIKSRETYPLMQKAKIDITDLGSKREEQFISALAEKIPGLGRFVRASGRAYTGFASKFRADIFDSYVKYRMKTGQAVDDYYLGQLGKWINSMTGRGHLGRFEPIAQEAATALFSPRYFKSTIDKFNPVFYAKLPPEVRKEALKTLGAFVGGTLTTLMLADAVPGVDVEWKEPTSANFLKVKIGKTKVDILGGMQQPMVLAARLFSNKLVSTTTGKTIQLGEGYRPLTRMDLAQSFAENKTTPVLSFLIGALRGKTSIGEPFKAHVEMAKRMTPIFLQDMIELSKENQLELFPLAAPLAFFGAGVQTYGPSKLPGTVKVTGAEKPKENWLEKILRPDKEVRALDMGLPPEFEDRKTLYKEDVRDIGGYRARKAKIVYGEYETEEERDEDLKKLQDDLSLAIKRSKRIRNEFPEDVFRIELDVHKSGGGMNVLERVDWASKQLKGATDAEFEAMVGSMLEGEVLTKSVAEGLLDKGIDVGYYIEGGKIKSTSRLSGKGGGRAAKKVTAKKTTFKAPKLTPLRKGSIPKVRLKAAPKMKAYKAPKIKINTYVDGIPAIKLKPVSYKVKIMKT